MLKERRKGASITTTRVAELGNPGPNIHTGWQHFPCGPSLSVRPPHLLSSCVRIRAKRFASYATPRPRFPSLLSAVPLLPHPFSLSPLFHRSTARAEPPDNRAWPCAVVMGMDPPPPPPPLPLHAAADRRSCREYLIALEEERRKIQVFQRELPLCLDLVTQAIERMRSQVDGVGGSEETVSDHGPVLEEFMPLKPSLSLSSSEEHDSARDANGGKKEEAAPDTPPEAANKKATPDWLQSVQLWSQEPQQRTSSSPHNKELPCKPVALSAWKAGGAFQPFAKEKRVELPASSTTAAASSAVVGDSGDKQQAAASVDDTGNKRERDDDKETSNKETTTNKGKEGQSSTGRKQRRCWAPELHRRFLQALQQLGGPHVATPKQIRELMKVDGLTNDEVKSHLQKYRLHTRRPNSTAQNNSASAPPPAPQFVVVGGIWVPPPEYAAAAAAAAAAAQPPVQLDASAGSAGTVYAPVATLPSAPQPQSSQQVVRRQPSRCSDARRSGSGGDGDGSLSASPAVSSSSQTTSA